MATDCTGNVRDMIDFKDVPTDSWQGRHCDVSITRCTGCAGSALVSDRVTGDRWLIQLPADYARDDYMAAYWAVEVSLATEPLPRPEPAPMFEVVAEFDFEDDGQEMEYIEDEDGSEAFARSLEARAERGTWFGSDPF